MLYIDSSLHYSPAPPAVDRYLKSRGWQITQAGCYHCPSTYQHDVSTELTWSEALAYEQHKWWSKLNPEDKECT